MALLLEIRQSGVRRRCAIGDFLVFLCFFSGFQLASSIVLRLTKDSFDIAIEANPFVLVQFYAPWCGHCKQLEPEFEAAAEALAGRVVLAKIDATVEKDLAERFEVGGYPTLHFFKNANAESYDGGLREASSIVEWVEAHMGSALKELSSDEEVSLAISQRGHQTIFVLSGSHADKERFAELANANRGLGLWYFREASSPSLRLHRGVGEVATYSADLTNAEAILEFLKAELLPQFGEIGEHNYEPYLQKKRQGMFWVCFNPESFQDDARKHKAVFTELATMYTDYNFVYTDTKEYAEHVKEELGCSEFPTIVLQLGNPEQEKEMQRFKMVLTESPILVRTVASFIDDVRAGRSDPDDGLDELDEGDEEEEARGDL